MKRRFLLRRTSPIQSTEINDESGSYMEMIDLNGRSYRLPTRPTVVICADGCDPAYVEAGLAAGVLPTVGR